MAVVKAVNDGGTAIVATTAIASPLWLDRVQTVSEYAEIALPILGALWLVVQIVYKIREYNKSNGRK